MSLRLRPEIQALLRQKLTAYPSRLINRGARLTHTLFRTLKEQVVHGRIFQTIDEVRDAVRAFVVRYNAEWLIEKNGHRSPLDARAAWLEQTFRRAA